MSPHQDSLSDYCHPELVSGSLIVRTYQRYEILFATANPPRRKINSE